MLLTVISVYDSLATSTSLLLFFPSWSIISLFVNMLTLFCNFNFHIAAITIGYIDIFTILNTHNTLRGNVDPPASNMQILVSIVHKILSVHNA